MNPDFFRRSFLLLATVLFLSACANRPDTDTEQKLRIEKLAGELQKLAPDAPKKEAQHFADVAVKTSASLREQYQVDMTPWLHNIEVNSGLKPRGLCFHYARDLAKNLQPLTAPHWQLYFVQARAKKLTEHNAIVITAKGESWETGIVLDGWRHAGVLYFGPVAKDKYPWQLKVKPAATTSGHQE
jgi:hypothetical protein